MTMTRYISAVLVTLATAIPIQGCSDLLNVTDPDIILDANSAQGALAYKNGVLLRLAQAVNGVQGPDAFFVYSGLLADEWRSGDTFVQRNNHDQRIWDPQNTFYADPYRRLNRLRVEAEKAVAALRTYLPPDSSYLTGRMFALSGYAEVLIGENYCNGTPLSEINGADITYGMPLSNDSVLGLAVAVADSALLEASNAIALADARLAALPNPTRADTTRYRAMRDQGIRSQRLAAVIKGRALLARGPTYFAAAAAAVAGVPDTFKFQVTHSVNSNTNQTFALNNGARRYTMVDREGTNGLDFISANDPRLPRATGSVVPGDLIFDSAFPLFVTRQGLWANTSPVSIVTGVEARLIEAEAALRAGQTATWLAAINALRTNTALYPAAQTGFTRGPNLTAIADTFVNDTSRIMTTFRERAFWMFGTGHRLGDLRRLVRQYNRPADSVYPIGAYYKGGLYGTAYVMAVPFEEVNNPNFTQCTDQLP
jgi:starch-binding outer membrane protein, SusD/RagB family